MPLNEWIDDLYWQLLNDPLGRWTLNDIDSMDIFYYIKLLTSSKERNKKMEQITQQKEYAKYDDLGIF